MSTPKTASVIVIGGGAVGCSIAYHLARRGVRDVVVLERETVGSGTTSKAAGGIRAQFGTEPEIRFSLEGQKVLETFKEEFGGDPGFQRIGYLFLVSSPATLRGFETRIALQRRLGVDVRVITPKEAQAIVPALNVDDLVAAVWGPQDGGSGVTFNLTPNVWQYVAITRETNNVSSVYINGVLVGSNAAPSQINYNGNQFFRLQAE